MAGTMAIRAALVARAIAVAPGAALPVSSVAWEGKKFTPVHGTRYYRATFLPGEPSQAELGDAGRNRHYGLFQIDVFEPANTGDAGAAAEAERIAAAYCRGTVLENSGVSVKCIKSYRTPGDSSDPAWFMVSAIVQWQADVGN